MILARCPECATTFRVTPEQLKARAGKVRCGQCQTIFNAFDALVDAPGDEKPTREPGPEPTAGPAPATQQIEDFPLPPPATPDEATGVPMAAESEPIVVESTPVEPDREAAAPAPEIVAAAAAKETPAASLSGQGVDLLLDADAPAATVRQQAQAVGLVAARETRELPGYNKWAERPIAGGDAGFETPAPGPRWPAALAAVLLVLALAVQAVHHFRGEIAIGWPATAPWLARACALAGCELPLPRQAELVSIEGSELQADNARGGLLALQATLKNRAAFAQAYPALELTLTDAQDRLVARRVLSPAEYLPAAAANTSFAANADLAVRLWVDASASGAAGYRLYVFYP